MPVVNSANIPAAKKLSNIEQKPDTVVELKQMSDSFDVITEAKEKAAKIVNLGEWKSEIETGKKEEERLAQELKDAQKTNMELVNQLTRAELGGKIEHLEELIKSKGPDKDIAQEISEIKKAAIELGLQQQGSPVGAFKEFLSVMKELNPPTSLANQFKEAKTVMEIFNENRPTEGMPANVTVELKKMELENARIIEEMRDERARRDQEWQLTVKKWDTEQQLRVAEINARINTEHERNQLLSDAFTRVGKAIAAGSMARAPGGAPGAPQGAAAGGERIAAQYIEAGEGEFGELQCGSCGNQVAIAADTTQAVCASCGSLYLVRRSPVVPSE